MPKYSKGAEYKAEHEPPFLPCQVEPTQSIRFRFSHMQHKYLRPEANSRSTTGLLAATSPKYSVPLAAAVTYIHFFRISQAFLESTQWRIQDFPWGGANSQKCYYFSIFCQKLHENERIWTPRGGARPWRPPWIRQWYRILCKLCLLTCQIVSVHRMKSFLLYVLFYFSYRVVSSTYQAGAAVGSYLHAPLCFWRVSKPNGSGCEQRGDSSWRSRRGQGIPGADRLNG